MENIMLWTKPRVNQGDWETETQFKACQKIRPCLTGSSPQLQCASIFWSAPAPLSKRVLPTVSVNDTHKPPQVPDRQKASQEGGEEGTAGTTCLQPRTSLTLAHCSQSRVPLSLCICYQRQSLWKQTRPPHISVQLISCLKDRWRSPCWVKDKDGFGNFRIDRGMPCKKDKKDSCLKIATFSFYFQKTCLEVSSGYSIRGQKFEGLSSSRREMVWLSLERKRTRLKTKQDVLILKQTLMTHL